MTDERAGRVQAAERDQGARGSIGPADMTQTRPPGPSNRELDDAALAEDIELALDMRQKLLSQQDPSIDYYTLLGVGPTADKKEIKRAYYELAAQYHPDRHFRKRLGSFKLRLESFFSRITIAQETLGNATARAEYDAYLEVQRRSRQMEQLITDAAADALRAGEQIERAIRLHESPPPSPPGPSNLHPNLPPPTVSAAARRDAFARRLLGGRPNPGSVPKLPVSSKAASQPPPPVNTTADAMDALRRRYEERVVLAKQTEGRKHVARGEQAVLAGQVIEAANAFRVASSLSPDDAELAQKWRDSQVKADALLAETYTRQAEYEEKGKNWAAAARSWVRVSQTRPNDVHAHERGVTALLTAGGDLHLAARLAQRACELEPTTSAHRLTLANVYLAANMKQNARRELQIASKLGANAAVVDAMLKRLAPPT